MNDIETFLLLLIAVITIALIVNRIFPPDYHQRIEEKYNKE